MTRRPVILGVEIALVLGYLAAFAFFATQSRDFIAERNERRATDAALAAPPTFPFTATFDAFSRGQDLLSVGWWNVEAAEDGAWSKGRASLVVPVPAAADTTLTVEGEPFLTPSHAEVVVVVRIDDNEAGRWTFRYGEPLPTVSIGVGAQSTGAGVMELSLEVLAPASPEHHGAGDDHRKLGFYLRSITVDIMR